MSYFNISQHIPLFGGNIWYVDSTRADDTGSGKQPHTAKKTFTAAIGVAAAGDAINVRAGTYAENVTMNLAGLELWSEIGVFIAPAAGNALTISANSCRIKGTLWVTGVAAATGIVVSGDYGEFEKTQVIGGATGWSITGTGNRFDSCKGGNQTSTGFDIQGVQAMLYDCSTVGVGASYGYKVSGGVDTGVIVRCTSANHQTSGFYIDTGSSNWTVLNCSSGAGDGTRRDIDNTNVWSNFSYDSVLYKEITFTAAGGVGGAGTNYNIFKVTGAIKVHDIVGHLTTGTPATNSTVNLELYSTNAAIDITASGGAPDLVSRVAGTVIAKIAETNEPLSLAEPDNTPALIENTNFRDPNVPIILCKDDAADTYIQVVLSAALASGVCHFHVEWEPITDDGSLEPA